MVKSMENFVTELVQASGATLNDKSFSPVARYYSAMDFVLYLNTDCSYRADRVDSFLTVLWHPQKEELVGIKLKGFNFLFERLRAILDLGDKDFIPLVKALEIALVGGAAEALISKVDGKRKKELYDMAISLTKDVCLPLDEWKKAA